MSNCVQEQTLATVFGRYDRRVMNNIHRADYVECLVAMLLSKRGQREGRSGGQGRWWGIANRAAYRSCAVVVEADLPSVTAARIAAEIEASWREFAQRTGGAWEHWPRWASGRHVREILEAAGATEDLFGANWVYVTTGDVLGVSALTEHDFGAAAVA